MAIVIGGKHFGEYTYEHWFDHEYGDETDNVEQNGNLKKDAETDNTEQNITIKNETDLTTD